MVAGGNGTVWTLVRNGNYVCCAVIPGVSGTDGSDGPPPFEDVFASDDVELRVYDTILQTREPTAYDRTEFVLPNVSVLMDWQARWRWIDS